MTFIKSKIKNKRQLQTRRTQHQSQNVHIHIHKDDKPKPKRNTKPKPINNYGRYDRDASPYDIMTSQNRALKPSSLYNLTPREQALLINGGGGQNIDISKMMKLINDEMKTEFLKNQPKQPLALPPTTIPTAPTTPPPTTQPTTPPLLHPKKNKPLILPPDTPTPAQNTPIQDTPENTSIPETPPPKNNNDFTDISKFNPTKRQKIGRAHV